ncbi:MAG TPA: sugar-specific transcriptional regulator TrmB [Methanocorpusculum sp.]|nr:sugar-specific transcriptional regulator TrmB [Methanocorpusculum sp.]HJJ33327.1 sugar-specific transcriptional regulator TrmB [Methanocorpusculum sp.]HJJ45271.1 sugar-specific transcriptional regulator TrmB [Methanocorpusculum sp.]HJJ58622.1 sugar-specific transcriptional regulator TrmB [Methanocorpusculum sp.]HJJ60134.1 sugar-specific transcriptional regulator TrmB [Methanocorpusculum sp.]
MPSKEDSRKKTESGGVLRRRTLFLQTMRKKTFESGYFTTAEIAEEEHLPRSTAQDWINRLVNEGCIFVKEEQHGRSPARYAARSALPKTTCRRIFTTAADGYAEIFHECMSSGCAGFCEFHHRRAGGAAVSVSRDGLIFRETAKLSTGDREGDGEYPLSLDRAAVGLSSVRLEGDEIVQTIRSIYGGAAYSLSSMMGEAKGVGGVEITAGDGFVTGKVRTKALVPVTIGVDDTDRKGCGGATFALANALFKYLTESHTAIGIRHQVAALCPDIPEMTAGNSCSFLELAVPKENMPVLSQMVCRFVDDESVSENWGVAVMTGIFVPGKMEALAAKIRRERVSSEEVREAARACGVEVFGKRGIIGAAAAVALKNQPQEVLLDAAAEMEKDSRRDAGNQ